MRYLPALDGLRALAVFLVVFFHAKLPFDWGGFLGVDIFFVISGVLITGLLLDELGRRGRVDFSGFYFRRVARLMPALLLLLSVYCLIAPLAWPLYGLHFDDALLVLGYWSDYTYVFLERPDKLRHTWSLAVEMHFYVVWPLVMVWFWRCPNRLVSALLVLYLVLTLWRFISYYSFGWDATYYRLDSRFSGLVLGALLVVWFRLRGACAFSNMNGYRLTIYLALLLTVVLSSEWNTGFAITFGVMAAELLGAFLVFAVLSGHASANFLMWTPLRYIGKLSYGIYLFHFPIMFYLRDSYSWCVVLVAGGLGGFILAAFSYHTVEAWVRRRIQTTLR